MFYFKTFTSDILGNGNPFILAAIGSREEWHREGCLVGDYTPAEMNALRPILAKYNLVEEMEGIYSHDGSMTERQLHNALSNEPGFTLNTTLTDDSEFDPSVGSTGMGMSAGGGNFSAGPGPLPTSMSMDPNGQVPQDAINNAPDEDELVRRASTRSIAQLFGLAEDVEIPTQTTQTVRQREFDGELYKDALSWSPALNQTVAAGEPTLKTLSPLAQDQFLSLFQEQPEIVEDDEILASHRVNKMLMEECMKSEKYQELADICTLDTLSSTIGAEILVNKTLTFIEEKREEARRKREEQERRKGDGLGGPGGGIPGGPGGGPIDFDQLMDSINKLKGAEDDLQNSVNIIKNLDDLMKTDGPDGPGTGGLPGTQPGQPNYQQQRGQTYLEAEAAKQLAEMLAKQIQEALPQHQNTLEDVYIDAVEEATDEVNEIQELLEAWGMGGGNPNVRIPMHKKRRALERLRKSKELKKLADLVGHFKRLAEEEQRRKSKDGAVNIKSVETGNDLVNTLPSEKMLLCNETTKKDFMRRYHQKELMQYELEAQNPMGKGPIVACVDVSGSMHGKAEEWSKAVALALADIAQKQRRNFACILFDGSIYGPWIIEKGEFDPNVLIDIAEKFPGGGTDFTKPLRKAMEIIKKDGFKKADIVFITDGECSVSDDFLKEFKRFKEDKEVAVRSVLINVGGGSSRGSLKEFSDSIAKVSSLADMADDEARKIFQAV